MKYAFVNVDTQKDFMNQNGSLFIPGSDIIKSTLKSLTEFASDRQITVINTCDWHRSNSQELSDKPDFVKTFPPHCIADTDGATFISETDPRATLVIDWRAHTLAPGGIKSRNITILKDNFDVFTGNKYAEDVIKSINIDIAIVYGVAMDYCVNYAVNGLLERGYQVYVVIDAIKEISADNIAVTIKNWSIAGAKFVSFNSTLPEYAEKIRDSVIQNTGCEIAQLKVLIDNNFDDRFNPEF